MESAGVVCKSAALYLGIHALVRRAVELRYPQADHASLSKHLVSLLHSLISCGGLWCMRRDLMKMMSFKPPTKTETEDDPVWRQVEHGRFFFGQSMGYFLHDILTMYLDRTLNFGYLLHHVAACVGCALTIFLGAGQPFLLMAYSAEINSVFLHLHKILLLTKFKVPSLLPLLNVLTLVAVRVIFHGFALLQSFRVIHSHRWLGTFGSFLGSILYGIDIGLLVSVLKKFR